MASRGREHPEPECTTRSPFQRDRDRILHATAFRRLTYKTQVFVFHEGDHYRTRLTHSLEVAQIARTVARQLRLDEDLAEAIALAHDLGHPPFGHAGERALDGVMRDFGGFDHNAQSLRVVTRLERKYAGFDGLNLTWETLEGLAKHNGPLPAGEESAVAKVARGLERWRGLDLETWPSAEAQVAALADDIAYVSHDIDDGLRADLITLDDLEDQPIDGAADCRWRSAGTRRRQEPARLRADPAHDHRYDRRSRRRNAHPACGASPCWPEDIRAAAEPTVAFSPAMTVRHCSAQGASCLQRVYRHERVMAIMHDAEGIVRDLFARYLVEPACHGRNLVCRLAGLDERRRARLIADFVAGMTDRYALLQHRRLFDATPELR